MMKKYLLHMLMLVVLFGCGKKQSNFGKTSIATWADDKKGAISITYDDATINHFRKAIPIMDSLKIKGTFFINTCDIPDSKFPPRFIGRTLSEIVKESATVPTSESNLFERGSALRFLDIPKAIERHNEAGALFESGKAAEAIQIIEAGFAEARKRKANKEVRPVLLTGDMVTWPEIKAFAANGHEFGNHTISHPRLAILDEANLLYELEKCKEEIYYQLGTAHTFSAECPFGTENERVMQYASKIHPALRNRMPEKYLEEINRGSKKTPSESDKPYIQWQRGPLQRHSLAEMKSWVDTLAKYNNVWLVLTFHGIDGIGWEAKPSGDLSKYFKYMKESEDRLWIETFGNVTKYHREKMYSTISVDSRSSVISVDVINALDSSYNFPLTMKTYVSDDWENFSIKQRDKSVEGKLLKDDEGTYLQYKLVPNIGRVVISKL